MVKVIFFASLRENLGTAELQVAVPEPASVAALVTQLVAVYGDHWALELNRDNVLVAVNQALAERHQVIVAGDEVAFFPPVTGG
jgi:sulfur-carrier protein